MVYAPNKSHESASFFKGNESTYMTFGRDMMDHEDPIKDILTKAIEAYDGEPDALVKFELSAFIFSRVFAKLEKKSKREAASLMIILVLGIWRYGASDLFTEKRKSASVLMNRKKRFKAVEPKNQVKELLFHIKCTKESGTPELIDLYRSREEISDVERSSLPSEESLALWIGTLSSIMAGLAGLVRKEATCMLPMPEQKKVTRGTFWKWILWFLAGSAAIGSVSVICS